MSQTYTANVVDPGDGSGEMVLEFPPELTDREGWFEGDRVSIKQEGNTIVITNLDKLKREKV